MRLAREEIVGILRRVDLFAGLPPERLEWLADRAHTMHVPAGEAIVRVGQSPTHFAVLYEGRIDWWMPIDGRPTLVNSHHPVNYSGTTNLLMGEPVRVDGLAAEDSDLLRFTRDCLFALVRDEPGVLQEIVRQIAPNVERGQAFVRQRDKLASLGSLAAGLAHEINNPAAAARAAAGELGRALAALREHAPGVRPALAAAAGDAGAAAQDDDDPLAVADREDALGAWLDAHGIDGAWELATELAGAGLDERWAARVVEAAHGDAAGALRWAAAGVSAAGLLDELGTSLKRVSDLVAAIKAYSYMDRAPEQDVDVHEGLESTLTILGHKLKHAGIRVERAFDRSLPPVPAAGSELNQVWTNLVDNAIAAAPGGRIRLATARQGDFVRVEVADDGSGIPPDVRRRMFDPFYTTKPVGEGTGLGLDVVWRVVVDSHGGQVDVRSEPGDTRFTVLLPLNRAPSPAATS